MGSVQHNIKIGPQCGHAPAEFILLHVATVHANGTPSIGMEIPKITENSISEHAYPNLTAEDFLHIVCPTPVCLSGNVIGSQIIMYQNEYSSYISVTNVRTVGIVMVAI